EGLLCSPEYWVEHVRRPVRFADGVAAMRELGAGRFLEIGPGLIQETGPDLIAVPTLRKDRPEPETLLSALATLWAAGTPVDWDAMLPAAASPVDLPTYPFQRRRYWLEPAPDDTAEDDAGSWCYRTTWKPRTVTPLGSLPGTWILAVPSASAVEPWARSVQEALTAADELLVMPVEEVAAGLDAHAVRGVLSLAPLHRTLDLIRTLAEHSADTTLWCVTRDAVNTAEPDPAQAALWGLGRTAAVEHPRMWGGLLDLPETLDERVSGMVRAILAEPGGEDELCVRPSGVLARRLVRAGLPEEGAWNPAGTVLVTGNGDVRDALVCRWLTDNGAEQVVLAGDIEPDRDDLRELGVRVEPCVLHERDALADLVRRIGPVDAVVHTAGTMELTALTDLTADELTATLGTKAVAAELLDELFADTTLDAFVLFSSVAGLWGSVLHGAYAAANARLDAVAARRRARGLRAASVAWGPWDLGTGDQESLARSGLRSLDPGRALSVLQRVAGRDEAYTAVASVEWDRFVPLLTSLRPGRLLEDLPAARAVLRTGDDRPADPAEGVTAERLRGRLAEMSADDRDAELLHLVRSHVAAVLGHAGTDGVDPDRAFTDSGFDSLTAVDLRNRLVAATGLALAATLVFDHPTPAALAAHLREELLPDDGDPVEALKAQLGRLEATLEALALEPPERAGISRRLRALAGRWEPTSVDGGDHSVDERLREASDEEMFEFIHQELAGPGHDNRHNLATEGDTSRGQ
ncbi:KR domain-containing protein, partial [Streptomyces phaeochromogenes]|uniref:type I polyketide synthase n=1 Tax=Streptomyces phaeochromogenes TaxID=1923 RepID=UPI0036C5F19A